MRTCICCGTRADAEAVTCANCGEASWSQTETAEAKDETNVSEGSSSPAPIVDPNTAIEVPLKRRNKRPN